VALGEAQMAGLFGYVAFGFLIGGPIGYYVGLNWLWLIGLSVGAFALPILWIRASTPAHTGVTGTLMVSLLCAAGFDIGLWLGSVIA
jgi:hypothetical protein